jgi:hypothetical protein
LAIAVDYIHGIVVVDQDTVAIEIVVTAEVRTIGLCILGRRCSEDPCVPKTDATDPVPGLVALPVPQAGRPGTTTVRTFASRRNVVAITDC